MLPPSRSPSYGMPKCHVAHPCTYDGLYSSRWNAYRLLPHHHFLVPRHRRPYLIPLATLEAKGADLVVIESKGAQASSLYLVRINCNVPGLGALFISLKFSLC